MNTEENIYIPFDRTMSNLAQQQFHNRWRSLANIMRVAEILKVNGEEDAIKCKVLLKHCLEIAVTWIMNLGLLTWYLFELQDQLKRIKICVTAIYCYI